jgi:MFS transporter, ACS family, D-galactonate transporter
MGVAAPVTTATGSFVGAFLAAGIVLVIGIVAYVFILGRIEPIADPPAA